MQIVLTGRHVVITQALRAQVAKKMDKIEELFPRVKKVNVVLSVEKYRHTAEIRFHADGADYDAHKTSKDMYASLESALKAVEQQAFKRKDKLRSNKTRHRRGLVTKVKAKAAD